MNRLIHSGLIFGLSAIVFLISTGMKITPAAHQITEQQIAIDSLSQRVLFLEAENLKTDSLYDAERFTSAGLRDQIIKLDDYRKELEAEIASLRGENQKQNQGNIILIVFNAFVAVLLLITLIFFLRGKKKKKAQELPPVKIPANGNRTHVFTSFEDKLVQLERLGNLKEKGLLSEEEFLAEKHNVLGK
jgi:hypothetical protein